MRAEDRTGTPESRVSFGSDKVRFGLFFFFFRADGVVIKSQKAVNPPFLFTHDTLPG